MNLIEQLKNNEKPFVLNTKAEQECFEKAGPENCVILYGDRWQTTRHFSDPDHTYRIKPDYQPEPRETEKCEVFHSKNRLYYQRDTLARLLHEALSDPDFMYFEYEDGYQIGDYTAPRRSGGQNKPADIPKCVVFRKATK